MEYQIICNRYNPLYALPYEEVMNRVIDYGCDIEYVQDQTPELCLAAVRSDWVALRFIKRQTLELCIEAVEENSRAMKYVWDEFYPDVEDYMNEKYPDEW